MFPEVHSPILTFDINQGFGNVGSYSAKHFHEEGKCKIIGIIEQDGSIVNPEGIDIKALMEYRLHNKTIVGFPGAKETQDDLMSYECDILIPAVKEKTINQSNVDQIKAKVIESLLWISHLSPP